MTHCEPIEWSIIRFDRDGKMSRHNEGAQSVFGIERARKILKKLGPGWKVRHMDTLAEPPVTDEEN